MADSGAGTSLDPRRHDAAGVSVRPRLRDGFRDVPRRVRVARAAVAGIWLIVALVTVFAPLDGQPSERWVQLGLLVVLAVVAVVGVGIVNRTLFHAHTEYVRRLERMAGEDELTGLANRRAFNRRLSEEFLRARRYGHPFTVVLVDLDGFKAVNDTFGHATGDAALVAFARVLDSITRASDVAARLGGDEFALLLPETDEAAARQVIRRLKDSLLNRPLLVDQAGNVEVRLSVSAGAASLAADIENESKLLAAADRALYADKRSAGADEDTVAVDSADAG
jgi:diguanylate cyclase (GGDEF)-like protein